MSSSPHKIYYVRVFSVRGRARGPMLSLSYNAPSYYYQVPSRLPERASSRTRSLTTPVAFRFRSLSGESDSDIDQRRSPAAPEGGLDSRSLDVLRPLTGSASGVGFAHVSTVPFNRQATRWKLPISRREYIAVN